jgi:probable phosphoglycerate mutase
MLYLVRHGQTEYNVQGRMQGSLDSPLTASGIEQARNIGYALRNLIEHPDGWTIESSPLPRARVTAEIIREELNMNSAIVLDERLREVSLGSWEGLSREEIDKKWPDARIKASVRRAWAYHCPDGEPLEAVRERLVNWLENVGDRNRVVVTHGIAGSVLRGIFTGLPQEQILGLPVQQNVFFELREQSIRSFSV